MKKFIYSFLGTMAGIWLSVLLGGVLIFLTFAVIASQYSSGTVDIQSNSVLRIDLSGSVSDRATTPSFMDVVQDKADDQLSLSELVNAIRTAAKDSNIDGLLLECNGASAGLAQCEEIINASTNSRNPVNGYGHTPTTIPRANISSP